LHTCTCMFIFLTVKSVSFLNWAAKTAIYRGGGQTSWRPGRQRKQIPQLDVFPKARLVVYPSSSCRLLRGPMAGPMRAAMLGGKKRSTHPDIKLQPPAGTTDKRTKKKKKLTLSAHINPWTISSGILCMQSPHKRQGQLPLQVKSHHKHIE
jgi:hypothetical protein